MRVIAARTTSLPGAVADPGGDAVVGRIFAGHDAGPGRTADLTRRIAAGELHPLSRDAVDVRTLVVLRALVAQVLPAKIIGKNENNVGAGLGLGLRRIQSPEPSQGAGQRQATLF